MSHSSTPSAEQDPCTPCPLSASPQCARHHLREFAAATNVLGVDAGIAIFLTPLQDAEHIARVKATLRGLIVACQQTPLPERSGINALTTDGLSYIIGTGQLPPTPAGSGNVHLN